MICCQCALVLVVGCNDACAVAGDDQKSSPSDFKCLQLHDANFQHLTTEHHAQLLHELAEVYRHVENTNFQDALAEWPAAGNRTQDLQA